MTGRRRIVGGLLGCLTCVLALAGAAPAHAGGWGRTTSSTTSGALRAALVQQRFVALDAMGTSSTASYTAGKLLGTTTTGYTDLENTGTVPVRMSGTVGLATFLSTTVTVARCSVPWSAGACPGTQTTLLAAVLPARTNVDWTPTPVPAGGRVHLRVTLGGAVANHLTLTATSRAARAPGDRTRA